VIESLAGDQRAVLLRRGFRLEWITLCWNMVGVVVLAWLAITASSVAIAGFGLDSLIEIGASIVVVWELSGAGPARQRRALRLIGIAFVLLAIYLAAQSVIALVTAHRASPSLGGILWTAVTAIVMFSLATGKSRTGRALGNPVLIAEGRVTFVDGLLALAVLLGLVLNFAFGWWWADPAVGFVIVYYAVREAIQSLAAV
jgi:divalent metal cation (Fe/Co/Zn/Cd) transporter